MQSAALILAFLAIASAQVPPTPCPSTPAQYCNCGEGDHGFKWLCRANNGYSWETNDAKPSNPCPCKYSACNLSDRFENYAASFAPELVPGTEDFDSRRAVFQSNELIVEQLNAAHPDAEFSLDESPFAHLTFDEFAATRLPGMPRGTRDGSATPSMDTEELAPVSVTSFDWRTTGSVNAVTPVKDQGAMGSCWAFSAVGNVEGQRAIQSGGKSMDNLSVEQLIECDGEAGAGVTGEVHSDCGVFGGWPYLAYQYWMKAGVLTDKQMPYCAGIQYQQPGYCLPCMVHGYNKSLCGNHDDLFCNVSTTLGQGAHGLCSSSHDDAVAQVKSWRRVSQNASEIAADLVKTGPLSIALDATLAFQFYKRGVLDPSSHPILGGCSNPTKSDDLNHAVLLVGFGTDGGKDYWTIKNSWGPKWGEDGYFRFAKGTNKCGVEEEVTTAILA